MTIDDFYVNFALPEQARLGARIYKKQILENVELNAADRKLITEQIETLDWRYTLKPVTCNIARYDDAEREYGEIALLHIGVKSILTAVHLKRLGEILQRAIPYPLILIFVASKDQQESLPVDMIAVQLADKRINRADISKLTTERLFETGWIKLQTEYQVERDFLQDFSAARCAQHHLYAFYSDLTRCIVALDIARRTGRYIRSQSEESDRLRQQILQAMHQLEMQLTSQNAMLKAETQFNRQLDLNVQIKQLQQQLADYTVQLTDNN